MTTSALKLYFAVPVAALLAALMTYDAAAIDRDIPAAGSTALACRASDSGPQVGDRVGYRIDGMTYRVIGRLPETALIQRGDEVIYADMSEIVPAER